MADYQEPVYRQTIKKEDLIEQIKGYLDTADNSVIENVANELFNNLPDRSIFQCEISYNDADSDEFILGPTRTSQNQFDLVKTGDKVTVLPDPYEGGNKFEGTVVGYKPPKEDDTESVVVVVDADDNAYDVYADRLRKRHEQP